MTHREGYHSPYRSKRYSGSSFRGSRDLLFNVGAAPEGSLLSPLEGITHVPRRASDTLVAPKTYRPSLEDYNPLRRKSDSLDVPLAVGEDFTLKGRRGSTGSRGSGQGSGDTLILPAVTLSTASQEFKPPDYGSDPNARRLSDNLMLPAVTVTADPSDVSGAYDGQNPLATNRPYSLQVPATRVRNVLMVRGRRNSSVCVAGAVFGNTLVGINILLYFYLLPCLTLLIRFDFF